MIDVYYWPTAKGHKIDISRRGRTPIYKVIPIDIGKGDQFAPAFLKIRPNSRMPAIVDPDDRQGHLVEYVRSEAIQSNVHNRGELLE